MASAGVVGMAEVVTPNSSVSNTRLAGSPAMWAFVWVGAAAFFLVTIHMAIMGRASRLCDSSTSISGISGPLW